MTAVTSSGWAGRLRGTTAVIARHRVAASIGFLVVFPWLVPYEALAVNIVIYGLYALGFNLLFGYTGLLSFGHAAFFGLGAYATGISVVHFGAPWHVALLLGVLAGGLAAAVIGALAVRARGIYFAMVTLALGQCVYYIVFKLDFWTGGENGLRDVHVHAIEAFGLPLNLLQPTVKYYFVVVLAAAAIWIFSRLLDSPLGAVLEAIRENESRARACGYDVRRTKWVAFVISGLICGLAGALNAIHLGIVPIETLHYHTSGLAVMVSLLGGMGTFFGPFIGATVFLLLEDVITLVTPHWQLVVGTIFIIFVLFFPRGIWGSLLDWVGRR